MADFVGELVDLAAGLRLEDLPASVVHEGRRHLVDILGTMLAGSAEEPVRALARQMADGSVDPTSTILGTGLRADPMWAALANGTAGMWHDFDPGNRFLGGHPAIHAIPAALALGEREGCTGRRFLEVTLAAYEVGARVGLGTVLRQGVYPEGSWPNVSAAVAAALLLGVGTETLRHALNISTSLTLATAWQAVREGATVRNAYIGFGAAMGVFSTELARSGFTAERDGIGTVFGRLAGSGFDTQRARKGLGEQWLIERCNHKLHACARHMHSALDALVALVAENPVDPEMVERIEVDTFALAAAMSDPAPGNALASKFSIPHALAAYLALRDSGIAAFGDEAVQDAWVRWLAARVVVRADAGMEARTPGERPATVTLWLRGGQVLVSSVSVPRGEFDSSPVTDAELSGKFLRLASPVLGPAGAEQLLEMLWMVERVQDVGQITGLAADRPGR